MNILSELRDRYGGTNAPCITGVSAQLYPSDLLAGDAAIDAQIQAGDVVALTGQFDAPSIRRMLAIIAKRATYVPMTAATQPQHDYFIEAAHANVVISPGGTIKRLSERPKPHPMLETLSERGHAGLVLFSSGTTGQPKAILHDFETFLRRFRTPRPTYRTLNFLLFDHIGGINTMLHTLYNKGTVIMPRGRRVADIFADIADFRAEVLPATPTFLRMMLLDEQLERADLSSLKVISYGTERMDAQSLQKLTSALPDIDFRQTYGMSELGILRVKSTARNSLWMKVGGEGVETKILDGVLKIRSQSRMLGYLNAPSPFDDDGWYDTKDLVDEDEDGALRIIGRTVEWINIGGEKVLPEVIEAAALSHPDILLAHARGAANPITGMHAELTCQPKFGATVTRRDLKAHLKAHLPAHAVPAKIRIGAVEVNHRFKRMGTRTAPVRPATEGAA